MRVRRRPVGDPGSSASSVVDVLPPVTAGHVGWPWTGEPFAPRLRVTAAPPRITVVTPSYNQGAYLEATLRSVLLQGYPNLEYVVIDGGSADASVEILRRYQQHLSHVVSEPDQGQADAINKGMRVATGDVMGWLNSDDLLLPGALWRIAATFAERPDVDVVCGFRRYIDERGRFLHNGVHERPAPRTLSHYCYLGQETVYWRRSVRDTVGPLDVSYRYALDFEYWHRMLAAGFDFELLPHFLGAFRHHDESKGARLDDVREAEMQRIYREYLGQEASFLEMHRRLGPAWRLRRLGYRVLRDTPLFTHPYLAGAVTSIFSAHARRDVRA